jgi:hypothetical protein
MSMTVTLIPIVIALGSTVSTASLAAVCTNRSKSISGVATKFADKELLVKTLKDHGMKVAEKGNDHLVVRTDEGEIHYIRNDSSAPYMMSINGIRDMDRLIGDLKEYEEEYGRNVQAFTYHKILQAMEEHGLTLNAQEVLEDDSILLTLGI